MTVAEKQEVRLSSNSLFHTPGVLRWAISGYKFKKDRKKLRNIFVEGFPHPRLSLEEWGEVIHRLLMGEISYKVIGEAVVFEF
jgi:hypothetical protein